MEMLLSLVFLMIMFGTDAVYVSRLYGTIYLPTENCGECPRPTLGRGIPRMLFDEQLQMMQNDWLIQEVYGYRSERSFGRYGEIIGHQTDCYMAPNGTFNCIPRSEGFCYALMQLGFRTDTNSGVMVNISIGRPKQFNGTDMIQIIRPGTSRILFRDRSVNVQLECIHGDHCLENQITVSSLLYRCD